ncbi:hypothetical protein [Hyperthermus butylicus]|uniref:hypothetical protein n=1 Tax=Hyperthermus butylicus TaxID=54248 RepID=UPI00064ECB67|nr:hypothetical protein [Hyperthermus butylicus]
MGIGFWRGIRLWMLLSTIAKPLVPINIVSTRPVMLDIELQERHVYRVEYIGDRARFLIDGRLVAELPARPGRMRAYAWIDSVVFMAGAGCCDGL